MPTNFAIRHAQVHNLWFDAEFCTWTYHESERGLFGSRQSAQKFADGNVCPDDSVVIVEVQQPISSTS